MIKAFWDALFDYADEQKKEGHNLEVMICREIEDILHKEYIKSMELMIPREKVTVPIKDKLMGAVLSYKDVTITKDPRDGQIVYNYGNYTFSTPLQTLKEIFKDFDSAKRTSEYYSAQSAKLGTALEFQLEKVTKLNEEIQNIKRQISAIQRYIADWEDNGIKDFMSAVMEKAETMDKIVKERPERKKKKKADTPEDSLEDASEEEDGTL